MELTAAVENLIEAIKADYCKGDWRDDMKERFCKGLGYKVGKNYIKITMSNGGSVWGFIVNTDTDKKFRKGDILKAAGWNAPARNAARGNIIDGGYSICWTGPHYLRG